MGPFWESAIVSRAGIQTRSLNPIPKRLWHQARVRTLRGERPKGLEEHLALIWRKSGVANWFPCGLRERARDGRDGPPDQASWRTCGPSLGGDLSWRMFARALPHRLFVEFLNTGLAFRLRTNGDGRCGLGTTLGFAMAETMRSAKLSGVLRRTRTWVLVYV